MTCFFQEDDGGITRLVDLGPSLGISQDTAVVAFDCQQGADLRIFLCVAVRQSDTECRVIVVQPFYMTTNPVLKLLPSQIVGTVDKIYVVSLA